MTLGRVAACLLGSALVTIWPIRQGLAAEPARTASAQRVELFVIGVPERQKWLTDSLGPHSAAGATLSVSPIAHFEPSDVLRVPTESSAALRCWVDLREATRARIYFSARAGKRFLLRDLELSGQFDEVDRESLSQVLASSWSALLDDEAAGLSREETRALLDQRAEPPASRLEAVPRARKTEQPPLASPFDLRLAAFYAIETFSRQLVAEHGPGLSISAGKPERQRRWSLWLSGQYRLPESERGARIGVRLEGVAARAGLELLWPLGVDLESAQRELSLRAGAGCDFTHLSPQPGSTGASPALTPARWATELVVTGSLGASTRLSQRAALGVRLFIDALPTTVVYELRVEGGTNSELSPRHVRAGLALEIEAR